MKLGQHFLNDRLAIERIVSFAEIKPDDRVLEIGPGTGILTTALATQAGRVYAVEVDPDLAVALCGRAPNVQVINADALTVALPDYNKIVSNLPYQISSKISYRLLSRPFELAILMFQKEFVERMTACPGSKDYGRLAMVAGFFCQIEVLESVPRTAFRPVPEVDSVLVRLRPREHQEVDTAVFMRLVETLFGNRRKKVKKGLVAFGVSREILAELDGSMLDRRPEELTPDEVAGIARVISNLNVCNHKKDGP
jgi:16S rRNA (adenine1518-N6/adenine1519-N6)-dimethyltransferase